jgi:hypothetical protein
MKTTKAQQVTSYIKHLAVSRLSNISARIKSTSKRRTTESADINRQKRRTKMPTLRKIKRGVLPTHLPTQKHHI